MSCILCRHCGSKFQPFPGKPGFIDECPKCLSDQGVREPSCREKRIISPSYSPENSKLLDHDQSHQHLVEQLEHRAKVERRRARRAAKYESNQQRANSYANVTLMSLLHIPLSQADRKALDDKAERIRAEEERKKAIIKRFEEDFPGRTLHL